MYPDSPFVAQFSEFIVFGTVAASILRCGSACLVLCVALTALPGLSTAQTPAEGVAAQVRAQGYQCDEPVTASRDIQLSKPDSAVWNLKCANSSYSVRLVPDMAAQITKLGSESK